MSYGAFEGSVESGQPVFKFLFARSVSGVEYRYTNADVIIGDSDGSFTPEQIDIENDVIITRDQSRSTLRLKLPRTNAMVTSYLVSAPNEITNITVWRLHYPDASGDQVFFWQGRLSGINSQDEDTVTFECQPDYSTLKRSNLIRKYQRGCPLSLYGQGLGECNVQKYDFAVSLTVTDIQGSVLTVPGAVISSNVEANYFRGGEIELENGLSQYIIDHSDSTITLLRRFTELEDLVDSNGQVQATFYPGCAHDTTDCLNRFDNIANYGGQPFFPGKNPFGNISLI